MAYTHSAAAKTGLTVTTVAITTQDTQYSFVLPAGCREFSVSIRAGAGTDTFRISNVAGKVATPTEPYLSYPANVELVQENLYLTAATTMYIACSAGSKVAQIQYWV